MTAPAAARPPKRAPSAIDDAIWSMAAGLFGARLGFPVPDVVLGFTRDELERDGMTTPEFERAAAALLRGKLYAAFPGADEFWSVLLDGSAATAPYTPPGVEATQRLIAAGQAPPPSVDALEKFAEEWRRELARCAPRAPGHAPPPADPAAPADLPVWATGHDDLRTLAFAPPPVARAAASAPTRAPRAPSGMTPLGALVGAALHDFAPPDASDAAAR